jgi:hypothetical protein
MLEGAYAGGAGHGNVVRPCGAHVHVRHRPVLLGHHWVLQTGPIRTVSDRRRDRHGECVGEWASKRRGVRERLFVYGCVCEGERERECVCVCVCVCACLCRRTLKRRQYVVLADARSPLAAGMGRCVSRRYAPAASRVRTTRASVATGTGTSIGTAIHQRGPRGAV